MKIAVIVGSSREASESERVAKYMSEKLSCETDIISLKNNPLNLWSDQIYTDKAFLDLQKRMKQADAYLIIVPEWNGMVPPTLKNFLFSMTVNEVGHKPAMICAISAGMNGAYPVAELKAFSSKNNYMVYIPDTLILKSVSGLFTGENKEPQDLLTRIEDSLSSLEDYAVALAGYREKRGDKSIKYGQGH